MKDQERHYEKHKKLFMDEILKKQMKQQGEEDKFSLLGHSLLILTSYIKIVFVHPI